MVEDSGPVVQAGGNRCGHDPEAPRWFAPPEEHRTRPTNWRPEGCSAGAVLCFARARPPRTTPPRLAQRFILRAESPHQGPVPAPRPR
jgi:hypothetical protein